MLLIILLVVILVFFLALRLLKVTLSSWLITIIIILFMERLRSFWSLVLISLAIVSVSLLSSILALIIVFSIITSSSFSRISFNFSDILYHRPFLKAALSFLVLCVFVHILLLILIMVPLLLRGSILSSSFRFFSIFLLASDIVLVERAARDMCWIILFLFCLLCFLINIVLVLSVTDIRLLFALVQIRLRVFLTRYDLDLRCFFLLFRSLVPAVST
mmetsp:Transcript_45149/g.52215  ORF Transcript_45149/g.52215 Transcript_45149/m.52215 type:complete len:217 (-) Transcript_45149:225-875(-)